MGVLKMFSLSLVLCFGLYAFANVAQAAISAEMEDPMSLSNVMLDEITAESLDLEEKDTTFWSRFKLGTRSIFTFDSSKQAAIDLKKANVKLLTAKKLANGSTDSKTQERLQKALEQYKSKMASVEKRIQKLPADKKKAISQRIDEHHLKQQQLLRDLGEKLPEQVKDKITAVRKDRIEAWYTHHKNKLETSLETATRAVDNGKPFQNLQIMATLEEMEDVLPAEAQAKLRTVINKTQDRLSEKLKNLDEKDQVKSDKYLEGINIDEVKKIRLINNLDNDNLPSNLRDHIKNLQSAHLDSLENRFKNLSDSEKNSFLRKNFETGENGDASKVEMLKRLERNTSSELKNKIRALNEEEQIRLKTRVKNTSNKDDLLKLERQIKDLPVIHKEIQDRRALINNNEVNTSNRRR